MDVEYGKTVQDIYRDFTHSVIYKTRDLYILHLMGSKKSIKRLCSWVPDYNFPHPRGTVIPRLNLKEYNLAWLAYGEQIFEGVGNKLVLAGQEME